MRTPKHLLAAGILSLLVAPPVPAATAEGAVQRGIELFEAGDTAGARAALEAALAEHDSRPLALAHLGRIALATGETDEAIARLREAVALQETDSMAWTWLGRANIQKLQTVGFFERGVLAGRALDALQKAVSLDPGNVEARVTLAGYYLNAPAIAGGSRRKARQQGEAVLEVDAARGHSILARVHLAADEHDLALVELERCIAASSDLGCRYQLGMLHQQLERWDEAVSVFEGVLESEPDARGALYQLGRTAALSGTHVTRGIECLENYLTLDVESGTPGYDGAHWRLGMLFEHLGEAARARAEYEAAIELNPEEERYRDSLEGLGSG